MAGDNHGAETQEDPQAQEEQPQVSGVDWEKAIAERDERIAALEQQVADAAKSVEAADALRGEIAELKVQGERVCAMAHTDSASDFWFESCASQ